jgi:hypothetical protein
MTYRLIDSATGKPFTSFSGNFCDLWQMTRDICSEQYGCFPDEIELTEAEDGSEIVWCRNKPCAILQWRSR